MSVCISAVESLLLLMLFLPAVAHLRGIALSRANDSHMALLRFSHGIAEETLQ
jgi:hypothetical protein